MHTPDEGSKNGLTDQDLDELFAALRAPADIAPRPGFYARVLERVEAQQRNSIWSVFLEPVFSRRLAYASLAMMLLLGTVLFTGTPDEPEFGELALDDPAPVVMMSGEVEEPVAVSAAPLHAQPVSLMGAEEGRNVVLADLASYKY